MKIQRLPGWLDHEQRAVQRGLILDDYFVLFISVLLCTLYSIAQACLGRSSNVPAQLSGSMVNMFCTKPKVCDQYSTSARCAFQHGR